MLLIPIFLAIRLDLPFGAHAVSSCVISALPYSLLPMNYVADYSI